MNDLPWWQVAKAQSLVRRSADLSPTALARPGDSFLIVTEGKITEPTYFRLLRADLQLSAVRVHVQPGETPDARRVVESAAAEAAKQVRRRRRDLLGNAEPSHFDQVWAVIDTDVPAKQGFWRDVEARAKQLKVNLAHSTPCFEFWLMLHLRYTTRTDLVDGIAAKRALREATGGDYSTSAKAAESAIAKLMPKWPGAIGHAESVLAFHDENGTPAPGNPSTTVCKLVRALNDSAPRHLRKWS